MTTRRQAGFTLLEMMIVVVVLVVIATIAIPRYVRARATANEAVVISSLRSLSGAQFRFKALNLVDVDGNGGSEYGWVTEMMGIAPLRGSGEVLDPTLLSVTFGQLDNSGRLSRSGYFFMMYLPDAAGNGLAETTTNFPNVNAMMAESYWTCLAWPSRRGSSGTSTFFVNQNGEVIKSTDATYDGTTSVPPPGAALLGTPDPNRIDSSQMAAGVAGADGFTWVPVKT